MCTALLRSVPGSREVYDALWNSKSVIVKIFSHKTSARRHLKREWKGFTGLSKLGLNSPRPLFNGKTEDGRFALIVEKIADSSTAIDVFLQTAEPAGRLEILLAICKELAKLHSKGVLQKDLHLGNFALADDTVFLLDPGRMRFLQHEVGKKAGVSQLAMLAGYLPDNGLAAVEGLCREYFSARGWDTKELDMLSIKKLITAHRKRGIRKGLKKSLRTSKRTLRVKVRSQKSEIRRQKTEGKSLSRTKSRSQKFIGVFDRAFCSGTKPLDFIEQIDNLMDEGAILKDGGTSYVSRLMWNNKDIVVKRYNHKGLIHSLRHTIKRSRARRGWLHAHRLRMLGIPTSKPLAYIEQRKAGLIWKSYLVTEYVEGQKLYDFLRDTKISEEERSMMNQQIVKLLDKLGKYRITHGDLKHSNILITGNSPVITDLDAMKAHKWDWSYKTNRTKDIAHLPNR